MFDLDQLMRAVTAHGRVARVVLAEVKGSAPRGIGTAMLVWEDGTEGTIGGGRLEFEAIAEARQMLASGKTIGLRRTALGPALNQCCGGAVTLASEVYDAESLPVSETGVVARPIGAETGEMPAAMARQIERGLKRTMWARGWLAEPAGRMQRPVIIYGAGHVGRALAAALVPLPRFDVTLADHRPEWLTGGPEGVQAVQGDPIRALTAAPDDAAHFIMTPEHDRDLDLCHRLLSRPFAHAGLIGSATKWARFRSRLTALGHAKDEISRITCPIGDPALGKHPQAIAVGVVAGLLKWDAHQDAKGDG